MEMNFELGTIHYFIDNQSFNLDSTFQSLPNKQDQQYPGAKRYMTL